MYIYAAAGLQTNGFMTAAGFKKASSDELHLLTGGGGHKLISDFVDRTSDQVISGHKLFYSTNNNGKYDSRAIEIREVNLVNTAETDEGYSPAIGFTWVGNNASVMSMHKNGNFYFTANYSQSTTYRYLYCNGIVKANSGGSQALTGDGGHMAISEEITSNTLVKRTGEGHLKVKDVISSSYQLHHDADNPYLKLSAAGNNYFIQADASGIWMGPSATDKSLIINSVGCAGLGYFQIATTNYT